MLGVFGVTRIYKGSNPSLVKVLGPKWDQKLFLAPKISYLCRKEILSHEINIFSKNPCQEKKAAGGASLCKIEG